MNEQLNQNLWTQLVMSEILTLVVEFEKIQVITGQETNSLVVEVVTGGLGRRGTEMFN